MMALSREAAWSSNSSLLIPCAYLKSAPLRLALFPGRAPARPPVAFLPAGSLVRRRCPSPPSAPCGCWPRARRTPWRVVAGELPTLGPVRRRACRSRRGSRRSVGRPRSGLGLLLGPSSSSLLFPGGVVCASGFPTPSGPKLHAAGRHARFAVREEGHDLAVPPP